MSTREIEGRLEEIYGVEVGESLTSEVTNRVLEDLKAWRIRRLDPLYRWCFWMRFT